MRSGTSSMCIRKPPSLKTGLGSCKCSTRSRCVCLRGFQRWHPKMQFAISTRAFRPLTQLVLAPDSFEAAGDLVIELGRYSFTSGEMKDRGKYIHTWRHHGDGTWRLYRNIANSDGATSES